VSAPPANPARDLALTMADFDASHADYGDALRWLEISARRGPLPAAWERKRKAWARRVSRRGTPGLGPPYD
jgi:hypothetical protein